MKGIVFTEFIEMVETAYGYDMVETLIEGSDLPSRGVYTSVSTYDDSEMIALLHTAQKETGKDIPALLDMFGRYLFNSFQKKYQHWMSEVKSGFDLLCKVDNYIHIEVKKLYPEANLPRFNHEFLSENKLRLEYFSERKMGDLAEGMIRECMESYHDKYELTRTNIKEDGSVVEFLITIIS